MLYKFLALAQLLLVFAVNTANLSAQSITPIAFGQSLTGTLPLTSSTASYTTPAAHPGDVFLVRATPAGLMALKLELRAPSGQLVGVYVPAPGLDYIHFFYTIPAGGESGEYKMIVSATDGFFTGNFCIFLQRANDPVGASFLNCNAYLSNTEECQSSILAYQYMVQEGTYSRLVVHPNGLASPQAWLCSNGGEILKTGQTGSGELLTLDSLVAPYTGCYYLYVTGYDAFFTSGFNVSHTLISGACIAPNVAVSPAGGSVCAESPFSLSASSVLPGATYQWSGPNMFSSTQATIVFDRATLDMSGDYSVTVTIPGVCPVVLSRTITIKPLPVATASVTPVGGELCAGKSFKLDVTSNATSPTTYKWNGPANYVSTQKSPPTINNATPGQSGFYHISVTDGFGCVGTDSLSVSVWALPTAAITEPVGSDACLGQTLQLDVATSAQNALYSWTGPFFCGFTSTQKSPQINNIDYDCSGTYYVTVTDAVTGCSNTASKYVYVNALPSVDISGGPTSLCAGSSATLSGCCSAQIYQWSTGAATKDIIVTPGATTQYRLTITDAKGCKNVDSVLVQVKPVPSISLMVTPENPEICSGNGQILLCAASTDAVNPGWKWTGPGFNSMQQCITLSTPQQTGLYSVVVTDGITGCTRSANQQVTIHATPTVSILQSPGAPYCEGGDLTLCATSNATGPVFEWNGPAGFTGSLLCEPLHDMVTAQSGVYAVKVTDVFGCQGSASANISINQRPYAAISGDLSICAGSNTVLTATGGGTYKWSNGSAAASVNVSPQATTTYTVTVTNTFGCTDVASVLVAVGANNLSLELHSQGADIVANATGGQPPFVYSISPVIPQFPGIPGLFLNAPAGNYTITVTDDFGCTATRVLSHTVGTVEPQKEWGLAVAPNPSSGLFEIRVNKPIEEDLEIAVLDINGRQIRRFLMQEPSLLLDISDVPAGYYLLRVFDGDSVGSVRLAVVK